MNKGLQRNNTSGYTGVCWDKVRGMWMAYIGGASCGRRKTIGHYFSAYEASVARIKVGVIIYGKEFMQ